MAVINTSGTLDTTMYLKSHFNKNMVGDNYYIQSLQQRRDEDWNYRYNVVDIEEEDNKPIVYSTKLPTYTSIEAVIDTVKTDKGEPLSDDWRRLKFKDLKYYKELGKRYRFGYDFEASKVMGEEEKHINNSIWITVNMNSSSASADIVVRRCNSNVGFVGSETLSREDIVEYHYEPCVIDSSLKNINMYYNANINVPQAEVYITMQYNYYTKNIQINDRLILGDTYEIKESNIVYQVKAVEKFASSSTFNVSYENNNSKIPLVLLALDKTVLADTDNFVERIANRAPLYKVEVVQEDSDEYSLIFTEPYETTISLRDIKTYEIKAFENNIEVQKEINITYDLENTTNDEKYYRFERIDNNHFSVMNVNAFPHGKLKINASCLAENGLTLETSISISLGGIF